MAAAIPMATMGRERHGGDAKFCDAALHIGAEGKWELETGGRLPRRKERPQFAPIDRRRGAFACMASGARDAAKRPRE